MTKHFIAAVPPVAPEFMKSREDFDEKEAKWKKERGLEDPEQTETPLPQSNASSKPPLPGALPFLQLDTSCVVHTAGADEFLHLDDVTLPEA